MRYTTRSEADTMNFARHLAPMLAPGDTVLLNGDLGAGKSVLARGIARGMGVEGPMPSPTFTLLLPYEGKGGRKLYHFDLYRLSDEDEYFAAGLDEFIGGDGVAVVEWPEMAEIDPRPALAPFVHPILEQLELSRAYLAGKHGMKIERVFLMGLSAGAGQWSRLSEESLHLPLVAPDPFAGFTPAKGVDVARPQDYLVALGAALAAMEVDA